MLKRVFGTAKLDGALVLSFAVVATAAAYSAVYLDPYVPLLMAPFFALGCAHGKRPMVLLALSVIPALTLLVASLIKFAAVGVPLFTYDHYFLRKNLLMLAENDWRVGIVLMIVVVAVASYFYGLLSGRGPFSRFERSALAAFALASILSIVSVAAWDKIVPVWDPAANRPTLKTFVLSAQVAAPHLRISGEADTVQMLRDGSTRALAPPTLRPDIFFILQELTLPPAALVAGYEPQTLFSASAFQHGPLRVHTFAGGTWRTEFSLVTQMLPQEFGGDGLYVFHQLAGRMKRSIFTELKALGYRTMVFYPVAGSFINAANFYHSIGVDEFYDPASLGISAGWEWTIPDSVLYKAMLEKTKDSDAPVAAFMLTINQHGPHDVQDPIGDYVARFAESDRAYAGFVADLVARERPAGVVAFGDHQPEFTARFLPDGLVRYLTGYDIRCINFPCRGTRSSAQTVDAVMLAPTALERFGFSLDSLSTLQRDLFADCADDVERCGEAQQLKFNSAFSQYVEQ